MAVRAGFEPTTLRTKGDQSTNEPPRPTGDDDDIDDDGDDNINYILTNLMWRFPSSEAGRSETERLPLRLSKSRQWMRRMQEGMTMEDEDAAAEEEDRTRRTTYTDRRTKMKRRLNSSTNYST